jgi:transcriptional regulator with XRE-family HTH domain
VPDALHQIQEVAEMSNGGGRIRVALPYLRAWREERVLTQDELSERSKVSKSTIVRVERGEVAIVSTVGKLAAALGLTREQLRSQNPNAAKNGARRNRLMVATAPLP